MKKSLFLNVVSAVCLFITMSCQKESVEGPVMVQCSLDYTFTESGFLSRSGTSDVYSRFYESQIKTRKITPEGYTLTFTNKETGATATVSGLWANKDGIKLLSGEYQVTGTTIPKNDYYHLPSSTPSLIFDETVFIDASTTTITLTAKYDCYLLLFDISNSPKVYIQNSINQTFNQDLSKTDEVYWLFVNQNYYVKDTDIYSIYIKRPDNGLAYFSLKDYPFEKGKYYYFNDVANSFDIPEMVSGNN